MATRPDSAQAQQEQQQREQEEKLAQNAAAAEDAQRNMVEEAENAGVTAFTFDPDASPEQKRQRARDVSWSTCAQPAPCLASAFANTRLLFQAMPKNLQRSHGFSIVTDQGEVDEPVADLPSPTKAGVLDIPKDKEGKPVEDSADAGAGSDEWEKTGWAPRLGWPYEAPHEAESLLDHSTWLEGHLSDKFFGG